MYNRPVRFLDPNTKVSSSFKTCFSFSVTNVGPVIVSIGDGLAFFIAPDDHTLGSPGGYLGVMSPIGLNELLPSLGNTIAVEFDTILDVEFHDPNGNQYLQLQYLFTKEGAIVIHACREGELQALQQKVLLFLHWPLNCLSSSVTSTKY